MKNRIVSWHYTLNSAKAEARLRQMPILEVIQPKGEKPLYAFGRKDAKRYYVVTSAPKTLLAEFTRQGIKVKPLSLKTINSPKRKKRPAWAWLS